MVQRLDDLEAQENWRALVPVIWRVLDGERDPAMYAPLDHVDALVVRRILEGIAAPKAEDAAAPSAES
jgi:hypothetical protein